MDTGWKVGSVCWGTGSGRIPVMVSDGVVIFIVCGTVFSVPVVPWQKLAGTVKIVMSTKAQTEKKIVASH